MPEDKPSQILIVEDDIDLAEMLNAYFRVQGYRVLTASWGEDAIRMARETIPDVVLLDIRLPDINGYEVCRQLRAHRRTREIPIIFLTEKRERTDKLTGLELGAVDYVTKPFDIQELRLRVRNTIRRAVQKPLTNPVTDLPDRALVDERLGSLLHSQDWVALVISLEGLTTFREQYGFVAADDVLRAVSLMITNSISEVGGEDDFIGHLDHADFVVITHPSRAQELLVRALVRLRPSVRFFYPLHDRERIDQDNKIRIATGMIRGGGQLFANVDKLKTALLRSRKPT